MFKRLTARCRAAWARFEKSERGVAAIEFALIGPVFFILLGTISETGLMYFTEWTLQTATQNAARLVRTGQAQGGALSASQFKTKICNLASVLVSCNSITVYVRSDANFATLAANMPNFLTIGAATTETATPTTACYNPGQPSQPAAVVATYDWKFNMWGMNAMGNINSSSARRLVGFAIFQNEPFPASGTPTC